MRGNEVSYITGCDQALIVFSIPMRGNEIVAHG